MSIAPQEKMFGKGANQKVDEDGCPRMEKVRTAADAGSLIRRTGHSPDSL
jgi:hypothetical protein